MKSLKNIWILSLVTYYDLAHRKIFYMALLIGFLLCCIGLLLGPLGLQQEQRMAINFGLAGCQMGLVFLSAIVGSLLIKEDISRKTLFIYLTKSVKRSEYVISKYVGFILTLFTLTSILVLFFVLSLLVSGQGLSFKIGIPFVGIFMESLIIFSLTCLVSIVSSTYISMGAGFALFLIGHWVQTAEYLANQSESYFVILFANLIKWGFPNLESFNWKAHLTYNEWLSFGEYLYSLSYGVCWFGILISLSVLVFNQIDLD